MQYKTQTGCPDATIALGEALGRALTGGLTIGLTGPLGAGKTQLVKGIAVGNSIDDVRRVTSPTFTLVHEYPGRLTLYHADLYRLRESRELINLGFDEWVGPDAVVVIEWAEYARAVIPDDALWIDLTPAGATSRNVVFTATGQMAVRCVEGLIATWQTPD